MITGLDHVVLVCPDVAAATADYARLLGRAPDWQASKDGAATALFRLGNTALELMGPDGQGPVADRLADILAAEGPGLKSLAFGAADIADAHHRLTRRGLAPGDITNGASTHARTGAQRTWRRFRCADTETAGLKTFLIQPSAPWPAAPADPGAVTHLDHIVIDTPDPVRALGLYGARLGLDLALDRTAPDWQTRFLFFRTGGLTFEVIHRLGETQDPGGPDRIWGLTWEVDDLPAAHARLAGEERDVSAIRQGRKPGSTVFTVRDGTVNVPTLFIAHGSR